MAKCEEMKKSYEMKGSGEYNGKLTTKTSFHDKSFYTYYPDNQLEPPWHFTLGDTGKGQTDQKAMENMHFTVTLGDVTEGHIYFSSKGVVNQDLKGSNKGLSTSRLEELESYYQAHKDSIDAVCACMAGQLV